MELEIGDILLIQIFLFSLQIKGDRDGRYITFPRKGHDFDTMLVELQTILNKNPDLLMLGIQLPDIYKKTMKKDLPIEPANLNHLYEKLPPSISVRI